jgi:hypothetical protein
MRHLVYKRIRDGVVERATATREEAIAIARRNAAADPTFELTDEEALWDFIHDYHAEWEYETHHTPGPWRVGSRGVIEAEPRDGTLAEAVGAVAFVYGPKDAAGVANAKLIAAAPALLAACCRVLNRWDSADGQMDRVDDILAAVEAALGEQ